METRILRDGESLGVRGGELGEDKRLKRDPRVARDDEFLRRPQSKRAGLKTRHYKNLRSWLLDLEGAVDAVDALDAANVCENGLELALVGNFEAGFDAGVLLVRPAFESADV